MKIDNSPARGMRDLLPADVSVRDHVLDSIVAVYRRFGYQRIETPALEDINRLQSGEGADNEKLVYQVLRRGLPAVVPDGTFVRELVDLGLRYDLTVPLTRFYGHNHAALPSPFRSLQVGPVWRAERPQKGRYRQFYQCDIDMIGEPTVLAEAELIEATCEALAAIGLSDTTVRLSDRRFWSALAADTGVPSSVQGAFFITLDKLDKIGWDGVRPELASLGLSAEQVAGVEEKIRGLEGLPADKLAGALAEAVPGLAPSVIEDLVVVASCLDRLGGVRWEFDPTLVRGMGYYTGQVFEIVKPGVSFSLAGGGRYDKLIGKSLGHDVRLRVLPRVRADRGPADLAAAAGRGGGADRGGRSGGGRARGGAGAARGLGCVARGRDGAAEREVRGPAQAAGGGRVRRVRVPAAGGRRGGPR